VGVETRIVVLDAAAAPYGLSPLDVPHVEMAVTVMKAMRVAGMSHRAHRRGQQQGQSGGRDHESPVHVDLSPADSPRWRRL
jgi:hypothetical protein